MLAHPEQVRAGLLIFKPINMAQNSGSALSHSANIQSIINQRASLLSGAMPARGSQAVGYQNAFSAFQTPQTPNGYQVSQSNEYQAPPPVGYSPSPGYLTQGSGYPATGSAVERNAGPGLHNYNFQQAANGQELDRQSARQQSSYSPENYGGDQSDSNERVAQPSYAYTRHSDAPEQMTAATTTKDGGDDDRAYARKRNAPEFDDLATVVTSSTQDSLVPLKYHDDSSAEDQSRLKQTVQRFFKMLQKQRCE